MGPPPDRQQVINYWPSLCLGLGIAALIADVSPGDDLPAATS